MKLKDGADIKGLHPCMRAVLRHSDAIWEDLGRPEGVTITAGLDGVHSAASWHYYGLALDLRTHYFEENDVNYAVRELRKWLPAFDVVEHSTHIHVEVGNDLAKELGVYF